MLKVKKLCATVMLTWLASSAIHAQAIAPIVASQDTLQWQDVKDLPPGAKVAVLMGNPEKHEPFVARLKLPANYTIPVHSHPINESDTILSGAIYIGIGGHVDVSQAQLLHADGFMMIPAKMKHYSVTKEETILQINGVGPWGMIYAKA